MKSYPLIFLILVAFFGCSDESTPTGPSVSEVRPSLIDVHQIERPKNSMSPEDARIAKTNFSEEVVLHLSKKLGRLGDWLRNEEKFPQIDVAEAVDYKGFDGDAAVKVVKQVLLSTEDSPERPLLDHFALPIAADHRSTTSFANELWQQLRAEFFFEDTQFGVLNAELLDDDTFRTKVSFEGRCAVDKRYCLGAKATQTISWRIIDDDWKIVSWEQEDFHLLVSPRPLFENVTSKLVSDPATLETITHSMHVDKLIERSKNHLMYQKLDRAFEYFIDWSSNYQFSSVSVLDLNGDGDDDLFVMDRWGKSVVLQNDGKGGFEDVSEKCGLVFPRSMTNCALFADFDNDGDPDVLIGRSLQQALYFRNENGTFVADKRINRTLTDVRFVTAGAVADINNDGLLDVYLSTYCFNPNKNTQWIRYAASGSEARTMFERVRTGHLALNRGGPPNVVLMNRNGFLSKVPIDDDLKQWHNSYQPLFSDFDEDGDQDIYLCNDFAPDVLLSNETEQGSFVPKFSDMTNEFFGGDQMAFGMGANLGDFNSDGKLDMYVSNMYSKAGHRVFDQIGEGVTPELRASAKGNFLYQNQGATFKNVAGTDDASQHVSKVGWSYGGQFADLNNDGKLDLYVPSGYFTAPEPVAEDIDL